MKEKKKNNKTTLREKTYTTALLLKSALFIEHRGVLDGETRPRIEDRRVALPYGRVCVAYGRGNADMSWPRGQRQSVQHGSAS